MRIHDITVRVARKVLYHASARKPLPATGVAGPVHFERGLCASRTKKVNVAKQKKIT